MIFLFLPNQLYQQESKTIFKKFDKVFVVEEPCFFYDPKYKPFKPSKIKLAYLRTCMKQFFDYLPVENKQYIEYNKVNDYGFLENQTVTLFDPNDHDIIKKFNDLDIKYKLLDSPNFVLSKSSDLDEYHKKSKTISFRGFFTFAKNRLDIFKDIDNKDVYNRKSIPPGMKIPKINHMKKHPYHTDAVSYIEKNFKDHRGTCESLFLYPTNSKEAYRSFSDFLETRLEHFGDYQDAIKKDEGILFHSNISAALNIGLLDPKKILKITLDFCKTKGKRISINNIEGFIRQIIGWREYMRYLYVFRNDEMIKSNAAKNNKRLTDVWFEGNTGILPFDKEYSKALNTGYAHHIVRLMIFLNLLILNETRPVDIYKWFMEIVCIDAYSWVMIPNIYAMGYFYRKAMSRPYLCSSKYIVKMSDYRPDDGEWDRSWDRTWDDMYHKFIEKKPKEYLMFYKNVSAK